MCIIVYKPAGVKCPSRELLKVQFSNNPDGCGLMFPITTKDGNKRVMVHKVFMNFDDFMRCYDENKKDEIPIVMHFRITTQGGIKPELTHPFPISSNPKHMNYLDYTTPIACVHNGIIKLTSSYGATTYSDTSKFATDFLPLILKSNDLTKLTENQKTLITRLVDPSRFAIMDYNGKVVLFGEGWINDNGLWFSNQTYKLDKHAPIVVMPDKKVTKTKYGCCKDEGDPLFYPIPDYFCPAMDNNWGYCSHCAYREVCDAHK